MKCPKCGTEGETGAWLCARCETILDPSFLGDDILNEATRSGAQREATVIASSPQQQADAPDDDSGPSEADTVIRAPVATDAADPITMSVDMQQAIAVFSAINGSAPPVARAPDGDRSEASTHVGDPRSEAAPGDSAAWDDPREWEDPSGPAIGDSVILGALGDDDVESVLSDRTAAYLVVDPRQRAAGVGAGAAASVFIGESVARLLKPDSVPRRVGDAAARVDVLSPFEREVFALIDGRTPLAALRARGALSENDVRVAMAMLIDKAMIELEGPPPVPRDDDATRVRRDAPRLEDQTSAFVGVGPAPAHEADVSSLDDHTRELGDLPPLAPVAGALAAEDASEGPTAPLPDEFLAPFESGGGTAAARPAASPAASPITAPLPPSTAEVVHAPEDAAGASQAADFAVPLEDAPLPVARPAMRSAPLTAARPRRDSDIVPPPAATAQAPEVGSAAAGPLAADAAKSAALTLPGQASAPRATPANARAAELHEMCMRDLAAGRVGRAWGYAKMAHDADPSDEKLAALLRDWNKIVAQQSGGGPRPLSPQELMAASQKAEQEGDYEAAIAHMRKLCEVAKNSASGWNRLGVLLATRAKQYRAGYDAVMRAVELEPANLTFQSNMMKILAKVDDAERKDGAASKGGKGGAAGLLAKLKR